MLSRRRGGERRAARGVGVQRSAVHFGGGAGFRANDGQGGGEVRLRADAAERPALRRRGIAGGRSRRGRCGGEVRGGSGSPRHRETGVAGEQHRHLRGARQRGTVKCARACGEVRRKTRRGAAFGGLCGGQLRGVRQGRGGRGLRDGAPAVLGRTAHLRRQISLGRQGARAARRGAAESPPRTSERR